ncbi:MAG: hypothetical protein AB7R89_11105 [Dehalococcoidia bacterium]
MTLSRIVDDLDAKHWTPHREAAPAADLQGAIRDLATTIREAHATQPARPWAEPRRERLTLRLPRLGGHGIETCDAVPITRIGPLIVLPNTPAEYVHFTAPFARAIGVQEVILGVADLSRDPLTRDARAATWILLRPPVIYLDHRLSLTEAEPGTSHPSYCGTLVHELVHVRYPAWDHDLVEHAVRRYLVTGALP